MIVGSVRSGLVEGLHPVAAVAVDADGDVVAEIGSDLDRPFFFRSAVKPFQAFVSQAAGADLGAEQLAVASASHSGQPVHIAYVRAMLDGVGLDPSALRCPPDRPIAEAAACRLGLTPPEPIFHNCSGKHSGMLRACVANGWSLDYTPPDHPLQQQVASFVSELTGAPVDPVGVDGCGIPTLRGDVRGLARAFARLAVDDELAEVAAATRRFASLTSDGDRREARLARWFPGSVKGGAMGCIGLAWREGGLGFAAKSWTGASAPAGVAVVELMQHLGVLPAHPRTMLESVARPAVFGGGRSVGSLQPLPT